MDHESGGRGQFLQRRDGYTRNVAEQEVEQQPRVLTFDPILGHLPPQQQPYRLSWGELHEAFVVHAPYRERRQRLYDALRLFSDCVWDIIPDARLWIDGGFVTRKTWAAPDDVDVVIVGSGVEKHQRQELARRGLLTSRETTLELETKSLPIGRLRPLGGLIDSYLTESKRSELWHRKWSQVTGPDGNEVDGVFKGYVEVVRSA